MVNLEIIGYAAGFLVAVSLTPQLIKTLRTKSTKDISVLWTLVLTGGLLLWIVYGLANKILPIIVFTSIEFLMISFLFVLKIVYK